MMSAFNAMQGGGVAGTGNSVPVIVFHGDQDTTIVPANAQKIIAARLSADHAQGIQGRHQPSVSRGEVNGRSYTRTVHGGSNGESVAESWLVHGAGHSWSGGSPAGSHTDAHGPDATTEMVRFFLDHPRLIAAV